jgi:hypothetical protein
LFKRIDAKDPGLAEQCYRVAEPLLARKGEYKLCSKYISDPEAKFQEIVQGWKRQKDWEEKMAEQQKQMRQQMEKRAAESKVPMPTYPALSPPKLADKNFVDQTRRLVEILAGVGKQAEAQKISDEAFEILPDPKLNQQ